MAMISVGLAALLAIGIFWIGPETDKALLGRAQNIFSPLEIIEVDPESPEAKDIVLGQKLFFDPRLSKDGTVSCASCHNPSTYGADNVPRSRGALGEKTIRNTPSALNLTFHQIFSWRGERESLEDQAKKSFTDVAGLSNGTEAEAVKKLRTAGYGLEMTIEAASKALAAYQRSLVTLNSPFDRFLRGDLSALTKEQKNGLRQFIHLACVSCHAGPAIGAKDVIRFGLTRDYWKVTMSEPLKDGPEGRKKYDLGRMDVTGNSNDQNAFKIPSLQNVAMTAPYFHDGSARDLETAIRWMGELQLDRKMTDREVQEIKAFLESLTGELPKSFLMENQGS